MRAVGCQAASDAERLALLGFPPAAARVTGNLKFDGAKPDDRPGPDTRSLLAQLGVKPDDLLLVAGSTHDGEETLLADMLPRLRRRFPNLFLILVPRHFERTKEVCRQLTEHGTKFFCRSELTPRVRLGAGEVECLLVNTTGELKYFYQCATVVFVGKSLSARGGQNPIEPAALGKAMVFGPHMQNFAAITQAFLSAQAAMQVNSAAELEETLAQLLADEAVRAQLGVRALQVVQQNSGATARTVDLILEKLDSPLIEGKAPAPS
jgi:3-deoxy-D-manno-octulosonic-acid transferase